MRRTWTTAPAVTAEGKLSVEAVEVRVADRRLLGPVSLGFVPGLMQAVIGPNGSGKSTLMKVLARQLVPSFGRVTLGGEPAARLAPRAFARAVAYLPQAQPARTGLTVRELVGHGRYPWHGPFERVTDADRAAIASAVAAVGLEAFDGEMVDTLSGGERQRAWIAMLVAQQARVLLLDEPTAALDLAHAMEVLALLRRLAHRDGAAVVVVLHDINLAARFCDRIVALKRGEVLADGAPAAVMQAERLEDLYGLPMTVLHQAGTGVPIGVPT